MSLATQQKKPQNILRTSSLLLIGFQEYSVEELEANASFTASLKKSAKEFRRGTALASIVPLCTVRCHIRNVQTGTTVRCCYILQHLVIYRNWLVTYNIPPTIFLMYHHEHFNHRRKPRTVLNKPGPTRQNADWLLHTFSDGNHTNSVNVINSRFFFITLSSTTFTFLFVDFKIKNSY